MSILVTRRSSNPLEAPVSSSRGLRRHLRLAAILVGALIVTSAALVTGRLDIAHQWFAGADNPDTDSDHDGLPDAVELSGATTKVGHTYVTDPKVADTDSDGLTDGEEAGALISKSNTRPVYRGISDPEMRDTDDDGVGDGDEYFLGTNPGSGDTDNDGLPDEDELDFGADPILANPDGDAYSDMEERQRGASPMVYDKSGWRAKLGDDGLERRTVCHVGCQAAEGSRLRPRQSP